MYGWLHVLNLSQIFNDPLTVCRRTWEGYKRVFITQEGRVVRPKEKDTVSEGQAYAMLRSVWMGDKETFDKCYAWAEQNLSRFNGEGDSLLAWHWKDGKVSDWMPASDADLDYALALVFADTQWRGQSPSGLADYGSKAKEVLADILRLETRRSAGLRLYLLPWIMDERAAENIPLNPSYYSPGHFRVFLSFTGDARWNELIDTSYFIFEATARKLGEEEGVGLVPDWCSVDKKNRFSPLDEKSSDFGWEAVRIPLRVALDYYWFQSSQAEEFFGTNLKHFLEPRWQEDRVLFCEYSYNGTAHKSYENALFYAAYACIFMAGKSPYAEDLVKKTRSFLRHKRGAWVYQDEDDYFTNSLAWFADGIKSGIIRNICAKKGEGN